MNVFRPQDTCLLEVRPPPPGCHSWARSPPGGSWAPHAWWWRKRGCSDRCRVGHIINCTPDSQAQVLKLSVSRPNATVLEPW